MNRADVTPALLRQLLSYDAGTGELYWLPRRPDVFSDGVRFTAEQNCRRWNAIWAGERALNANHAGYRCGEIFHLPFRAHRVGWAIHFQSWPAGEIDHIDGDRANNRIANMRDVAHFVNCRNAARRSDNISGVSGVRFQPASSRWKATIKGDGRTITLGTFDTKVEAIASRRSAELRLNYHPNHGRAA
jgi:hypothetical protein